MEVDQKEQGGKDRQGLLESFIGSALGLGKGMTLQSLELTPPPKRSPCVSPATYFWTKHHLHDCSDGRPVKPVVADLNMGAASGPAHSRKEMPASYYLGVVMPDACHRKLAIQNLDGKELYHCLGSE
uniref:Uncharacterized protein n=1 Tax=Peronospora matthiolae TaxID=2874970 RepID=A0AAV1VEB9_9STRA